MYDASLDQFRGHNWGIPEFDASRYFGAELRFGGRQSFTNSNANTDDRYFSEVSTDLKYNYRAQDILDLSMYSSGLLKSKKGSITYNWRNQPKAYYTRALQGAVSSVAVSDMNGIRGKQKTQGGRKIVYDTISVFDLDGTSSLMEVRPREVTDDSPNKNLINKNEQPEIRKNFNETAFFFPNVYADSNGNYTFSFTMPEALTKWKWLNFAHTKNLEFGVSENSVVTSKPIMVQPNAPRFLREGDLMEFTVKIANTTDKEITGTANLELIDATTGNSVDGLFNNVFPLQYFTVAANQSSVVKFPIQNR
ncbi:MAG: hypothetical protein NTZ59_14760 [Bacteroidetes bacterium]|nr:hypothetical protein [Bacteroidota bacterium]